MLCRTHQKTYALFVRSGLLELLRNDYEDLHGLSFEYLMQFLTNILARRQKRKKFRFIL
ncbi:MAG: DUF3791 domain-containing protein [Planctomycetaceae bacterium]|nr:DUF3791 domain-containing protein [Planctomycetaceae bacterium]